MNVLIFHHSAPFADDLARRIRSWGHNAGPCHDARAAAALMRTMIFDLAILEVRPAGAPGEQTIAAVKERQPGISIVAMSDSADPELQTRIRGTGIIYYMLIPSEIHHLKLILDHLSARTLPAAPCPPLHRKASTAWESPV